MTLYGAQKTYTGHCCYRAGTTTGVYVGNVAHYGRDRHAVDVHRFIILQTDRRRRSEDRLIFRGSGVWPSRVAYTRMRARACVYVCLCIIDLSSGPVVLLLAVFHSVFNDVATTRVGPVWYVPSALCNGHQSFRCSYT